MEGRLEERPAKQDTRPDIIRSTNQYGWTSRHLVAKKNRAAMGLAPISSLRARRGAPPFLLLSPTATVSWLQWVSSLMNSIYHSHDWLLGGAEAQSFN